MNLRISSLLLGACILVCAAVPGLATSVTPTRAVPPVGAVRQLGTRILWSARHRYAAVIPLIRQ